MPKFHKFLLKIVRKVTRKAMKRFIDTYNYVELEQLYIELNDVSNSINSLKHIINSRKVSLEVNSDED